MVIRDMEPSKLTNRYCPVLINGYQRYGRSWAHFQASVPAFVACSMKSGVKVLGLDRFHTFKTSTVQSSYDRI